MRFFRLFSRSFKFDEYDDDGPDEGTSFIFEKPSHVCVLPALSRVACPKLAFSFNNSSGWTVVFAVSENPPKPNKLAAIPPRVFVLLSVDAADFSAEFPVKSFISFSNESKSPKSS